MIRPHRLSAPIEDLRKINLQLFAGEEGNSDPTDDGEEAAGAADDSTQTEETDNGATDSTDAEPKRKSFTDEELSKYVARSTKKAIAKFMRDMGLPPGADMTQAREALSALRDGADGSVQTQGSSNAELRARNAERALEAVQSGVPADKATRYVRLAESYMEDEEDDFSEALNATLADFPITPPSAEKRGSAGAGANPPKSTKPTLNAGQEAARRRREQLDRSKKALENYGTNKE